MIPATGRPGSKMSYLEFLEFEGKSKILHSKQFPLQDIYSIQERSSYTLQIPSDKQPGFIITKSYGNSICFITR